MRKNNIRTPREKEDWKERYEILKKYNLMVKYVRKAKVKHKNERIEDNVKSNLLN